MEDRWRQIARHLAGESTAAEGESLARWAASHPDHAAMLEDARRAWAAAAEPDLDAAWRALSARLDEPLVRVPAWRRRMVAGGLLLAAASVALMLFARAPSPSVPAWSTGNAQASTVTLDDGSVVRLGPQSRLEARGARAVFLEGVAYFAVEHDAAAPFDVVTRAGTIRVLGTRFEARVVADTVHVRVVDGTVALSGGGREMQLGAGESGQLVRGAPPAGLPAIPVAIAPAPWMGRWLLFNDTRLSLAVKEIEAAHAVRIVVQNEALLASTITATFDGEDAFEDVMRTVCLILGATCEVAARGATMR
jgi:transmembrane sensor